MSRMMPFCCAKSLCSKSCNANSTLRFTQGTSKLS
uniref:Uncharacterized protein n=1 Tax=Arundo donax TaxID=35708 RepID=A0A0A8ZRS7_ARUDO